MFGMVPQDRLDTEIDEIEIGVVMLAADEALGYGELGVSATARNYERLIEKIQRLKGDMKGASPGKQRRLKRRIERAERKLRAIRAKKARQIKRRKEKGKDLTKTQQKFVAARKSRFRAVKKFKQKKALKAAYEKARAAGWPASLEITKEWMGDSKIKSFEVFARGVLQAYVETVRLMSMGQPWETAVETTANAFPRKDYRLAIKIALRSRAATLGTVARQYVEKAARGEAPEGTVIRKGTLPVFGARRMIPAKIRLQQLRAQRQAIIVARQRAEAEARQRIAAMTAQQQQVAAQNPQQALAIARQRQQYQQQHQQQMAQYQSQIAQMVQQEKVASSGAFQAFPYSTPLDAAATQSTTPTDIYAQGGGAAPGADGGDDEDEAEAEGDEEGGEESEGDEGESEELDGSEEGGEKPFYMNPLFLLAVAGGGLIAYQQYQKKGKGKDKDKSKSAPA